MALRADDVDIDRDRALVRRFQAGDENAFDELYRRYHDRLERFCLKRIGDQHAAEEIAQEAFTRALSALPELAGEQRFYPWVSVIASRLCIDHFRLQARSEPRSDPNPGGVAGGQEEGIVDAVDAFLVVAALARLAPRHQDVLHLREVEGWSYQRIADHYGVSVGTVETLLFRARRALRREFHLVDGAGLAVVPVIGWLVQRAARVRHRLPNWVPSIPLQPALAAAATATAAAVVLSIVPSQAPNRAAALPPPAPRSATLPTGFPQGAAGTTTGTTTVISGGAPASLSTPPTTSISVMAAPAATSTTTTTPAAPMLGPITAPVFTPPPTTVPNSHDTTLITVPPPGAVTGALTPLALPPVALPPAVLPPVALAPAVLPPVAVPGPNLTGSGVGVSGAVGAVTGGATQLVGGLLAPR